MEQIIYLEVDDNIHTVRDRLRRAQARQVALVVPSACQALRRPLDFKLLSRQAAALQIDLVLIASNPTWYELARQEGFVVLPHAVAGQRAWLPGGNWKKENRPGVEGLQARLRRYVPAWWNWLVGTMGIAVVIAALIWSAVMIWPSATIHVTPAREPVGVSLVVEADPMLRAMDLARMRVPARIVQVNVVDRGEVETTGYTNVAAGRAQGTVLFVNRTARQVTVPLGTTVSTSAGTPVYFTTRGAVTIEARGQARVAIQAVEPGPSGNVGATQINRVSGALAATLAVINEGGTGGGSSTQARRVTHGDKQRADDLLRAKLLQKAYDEITADLDGEFLPRDTMWINPYSIHVNYDQHVDDQADKLTAEMRAMVGGLVVSDGDALEIARQALYRQVRDGFRILPQTVSVSRGQVLEVDPETLVVRFLVEGVALMEAEIDEPLVRRAITGRPVAQAWAYLRQTLPVEVEPSLQINPAWMIRMPWMPFRILIVRDKVVEVESNDQEMQGALPGA